MRPGQGAQPTGQALQLYRRVRTTLGLADVIRLFGHQLASSDSFTPLQGKVLGKIAACRTAAMGGHEQACDHCGVVRYSYNSCGDRHCPTCQASKQAFWIDDLVRSTLPVRHYHLVFTVPHQLNALCMHNRRLYYEVLLMLYGTRCVPLDTHDTEWKRVPCVCCTHGGRAYRCIRTCTVSCPKQATPFRESGRP